MKIFLAELRKSYFYEKGWIILLFFIVFQSLIYGFGSQDYNHQTEQYKEQYQSYLASFGGKVNEQKESALSAEEERISLAEEKSLQSFQKLYRGEYTPDQYDEDLASYHDLYAEKIAFQQIQNQYDYARQDTEHRYILNENGWYVALQENNLNFLLVFCVILLVVRIFSTEYETQMYSIIVCTHNGKECTISGKLAVCLLSAVLFGVLASIICLLSVYFRFGIQDATYPIQSLRCFSACQYDLTIRQGYFLIWCFKIFSLCIISMITSLCAVLLKRNASAFFVSVLVIVLPYFLFDIDFILKFVPYLGLLFGGLYFRGIESVVPGMDILQMQSIPLSNLMAVCAVGLGLWLICMWFTVRVWNNRLLNRRKIK